MDFFIDDTGKPFDYEGFKTYNIQRSETLISVAKKLELDPFLLRQYHNRFCPLEDLIEEDFKSHLKVLILNPEKKEDKIEDKEIIKTPLLGENYILPFRPGIMDNQYSVLYTIEKEGKIQTLEQNFSVKRIKSEFDQNKYHFFEINKISELLINGQTPDSKAYKLAEETAVILYPLRVVTDITGKWVEINSYSALEERWDSKKREIEKTNNVKAIEKIINNIEQNIKNKDALIDIVSSNWFLRAFFNGIHVAYTDKLEIEKDIYFPAIAEIDDLEFWITQKVKPTLDDFNQIEVNQQGEVDDEYAEGYYAANYFLNPNNYNIEHLTVECNLVDINERKTVTVLNLNSEVIQLDSGISLLA